MKFFLGVLFASIFGSIIALAARSAFSDRPAAPLVDQVAPVSPGVPHQGKSSEPEIPPPAYAGPGFVATAIPERVVWVDGIMMKGEKVWVYISDGRVFTEDTKGMTRVDRQGVVIDGERIWMRRFRTDVGLLAGEVKTPENTKTPLESSLGNRFQVKKEQVSSWRTDEDGVDRLTDSAVNQARSRLVGR